MKRSLLLFLILIFILAGCTFEPVKTSVPPASRTPTALLTSTSTATLRPSATATITRTQQPIQSSTPSRTPLPSATPSRPPQQVMAALISSSTWAGLGLPDETASHWQAYADGQEQLSPAELKAVQAYLSSLEQYQRLALQEINPVDPARLAFRTRLVEGENGENQPVLYALDAGAEEGRQQLFTLVFDGEARPVGLAAAPFIEGLTQQIAANGQKVEYLDDKGRVLLLADAVYLDSADETQKFLLERLNELYQRGKRRLPGGAQVFPRFHYPVAGIEAGFYGLEKSLTYPQIILLKDAFELFNREEFQPLKSEMFGKHVSFLIPEAIDTVAGLTYIDSGVVELDRRDLFGNKYELAEVMAHEGAHVMQRSLEAGERCSEKLRFEVGDQTIPDDFYYWDAPRLLQAIRAQKIGAYHVSLWMFYKLNYQGQVIDWLTRLINTGSADGKPIIFGCD